MWVRVLVLVSVLVLVLVLVRVRVQVRVRVRVRVRVSSPHRPVPPSQERMGRKQTQQPAPSASWSQ